MDVQAFNKCYAVLYNSLDIKAIYPFLVKQGLTTQSDKETLTHPYSTNFDKINHLTEILPKKGDGWLDKFIKCLEESSEGTGHSKMVKELKIAREGKHYHNSYGQLIILIFYLLDLAQNAEEPQAKKPKLIEKPNLTEGKLCFCMPKRCHFDNESHD